MNLKEGIYITNRSGTILDANPAFLRMLGVASLAELRLYSAQQLLVHPEQRERELEILAREGAVRDFELELCRPDGSLCTVLDTAYAVTDPVSGEALFHGILVDITKRKQLEQSLLEMTIRDPLTGCHNRRYLAQLSTTLERTGSSWGAIVIDVDHFKQINDRDGHQAGDEVLVRLGRFLMRQLRGGDTVVRLGGDEFLLLLVPADEGVTREVGERLREAAKREAPASFSLGWAAREAGENLEKTIARADSRLIQVRVEERERNARRVTDSSPNVATRE